MKKNYWIFLFTLCTFIVFSCQKDKATELKPLDLISHGFPITVMAPDSVEFKSNTGIFKELTITGPDNYGLLVQSTMVTTSDEKTIKNELLNDFKKHRFFSKVIRDDNTGFLYEEKMDTDSTNVNYKFFIIKIQGDKEYRFSTPYSFKNTEEQALRIYKTLLPEK